MVRFRYHTLCEELPEGIFKIAIKDNYVGRNKFKLELSAEQVNNLSRLFLPVDGSEPLRDEIRDMLPDRDEYGSLVNDIIRARYGVDIDDVFDIHFSVARSPHKGRNCKLLLSSSDPSMSEGEMPRYGVERDPLILVSGDPYVDKPWNSYVAVCQRICLAPRDPLQLERDDFVVDSDYQYIYPQFDVYQPKMDNDMMQRNMDGNYRDEVKD